MTAFLNARLQLPADDALVSRHDLAAIFGVSYQCVYVWERRGKIPAGQRLGHRTLRWRFGDVKKALEAA